MIYRQEGKTVVLTKDPEQMILKLRHKTDDFQVKGIPLNEKPKSKSMKQKQNCLTHPSRGGGGEYPKILGSRKKELFNFLSL